MKKKCLSLLLAFLMLLTLLPFSGRAVSQSENGSAAFEYLKSVAISKGDNRNGTYQYLFQPELGLQTAAVLYDTSTDLLLLASAGLSPSLSTLYSAAIAISPSSSMPCYAQYTLRSNTVYTELDSSFTRNSRLTVYGTEGEELSGGWKDLLSFEFADLLQKTQKYVFEGSGYSIGDLGFTALAQELSSVVPITTPEPSSSVMPNGPAAYEKLLEISYQKTGIIEVKSGLLQFDHSEKDELRIWLLEKADENGIQGEGSITIPQNLSMPFSSSYWERGKGTSSALVMADLDSSFSPNSKFGYWIYNEREDNKRPDGARYFSLLIELLKTIQGFLNGTGYSIGDLGFTAFADYMGYSYAKEPQQVHELTAIAKAEPTCSTIGFKPFWICTDCHKWFCDAAGTDIISRSDKITIPEKGHSWGNWKTTQPATEDITGIEARTCSVCGGTDTRPIPKIIPSGASNPFRDVKEGAYYYNPVLWAVNHTPQITNGTGTNIFSPEATCTRDQIVTFLWRAMGCPEPQSINNPFVDVKPGDYFYKPVLWAVEKGITNGMDETHFGPAVPCTRAHVVTFLWRAHEKPAAGNDNPFVDVPDGQYYTDAVLWAVSKNITNGIDETHFGPNNACTRGQIVTFLYRD